MRKLKHVHASISSAKDRALSESVGTFFATHFLCTQAEAANKDMHLENSTGRELALRSSKNAAGRERTWQHLS
jgi:hypothetical protein